MAPSTFRLSTYNILIEGWARNNKPSLSGMSWETRRDNLIQRMQEMNADIYCLQEVDRFDSLAEKMDKIGYHGVHASRNNGEKEGCATFYKKDKVFPVKVNGNEQTIYYFNDGTGRMIQRIIFNIQQKAIVDILNSHLIFEESRTGETTRTQKELEALVARAQKVASQAYRPTMVCADLNITTEQEALNRFKTQGFIDVLAASPNAHKPTHIHGDQRMRIDYIFAKNISATANCDVWGDPANLKNPIEPSDHLPVISEFDLNSIGCGDKSNISALVAQLQALETEFSQDNPSIDHFRKLSSEHQNQVFGQFYSLIKPGLEKDFPGIGEKIFVSTQPSQDLNLDKLFGWVKLPTGKDIRQYKVYALGLKRFEIIWNTESDVEKIKQAFLSLPEWLQRDIRLGLWKKTQIEGGEYFKNSPKSILVLEVIEEIKAQGRYQRT